MSFRGIVIDTPSYKSAGHDAIQATAVHSPPSCSSSSISGWSINGYTRRNVGKVNSGNPDVTLVLRPWVKGPYLPQGQEPQVDMNAVQL